MKGVVVTGVQEVLRAIGKARQKDAVNVAVGLEKCARTILKKSQQYVPVDTGALKASGRIETAGSGMGARAVVVYGGPDAHYALYVHENLEVYHAPPTCAKFLERAVRETRGTCAKMLQREMEASKQKTINGEVVE